MPTPTLFFNGLFRTYSTIVFLLFLLFMGTLLSYYTFVGTVQFVHKRAYIHRQYSVSR